MTIEYFYNMGMEDAKKLKEKPDEYDIEYVMKRIEEFQEKYDKECSIMYAFGFMEIIKPKENTK